MMPGAIAAIGSAWIIGALGVAAVWPRNWSARNDLLLILPLGFGIGMAVTSATFFFATVLSGNPLVTSVALDLAVAALFASGLRLRLRRRRAEIGKPVERGVWLRRVAAAIFAQAAIVAAAVGARAYAADPYGRWDGWAIWSMHARFLYFGGGGFRHMLESPQVGWSHPDYPLLVPASIARAWAFCGSDAPVVSGLVSVLFGAATVGLLVGAVARLRNPTLGFLAGLVLIGTPFFVTFSASQYADIPLGFYILAAAAAIALGGRDAESCGPFLLAGVAAGAAAWTKNEGLLFALVAAVAGGVAGFAQGMGRRVGALYGGLLIALLPVVYFKLALSPPNDVVSASIAGRLGQIADWSRHRLILSALWHGSTRFGEWSVVPYLAMALLLIVSGRPRLGRHEWVVGGIIALTIGGYYCIYLLTPRDLAWQLNFSLDRLMLQLWPVLIFFWGLCLNLGESIGLPANPMPASWRRGALALFLAANLGASLLIIRALSRQLGSNELATSNISGAAVRVGMGEGWFDRESDGRDVWVWSKGHSDLLVLVEGAEPVKLSLGFRMRGLGNRTVTAAIGGRPIWHGPVGEGYASAEIAGLTLQPGLNAIAFSSNAPGIGESARPGARALAFALYDLRIR